MLILAFGILLIIASMLVIMGTPYTYYLKRDREWEAANRETGSQFAHGGE